MENYIAYYRVSTKDQDLGLEAQKADVYRFIGAKGKVLEKEFIEKETGTSKKHRPILEEAIVMCKKTSSILLIAKLDRLSRNIAFITALMEAKVKFVCCDMPDANEFTIHIFASMAQLEAKKISQRTKDALRVLSDSGVVLGKSENFSNEGRSLGSQSMKVKALMNPNNMLAMAHAELLKNQGLTLDQIADKLNLKGFKASRGGIFSSIQVSRLLKRSAFKSES